MTPDPKCSEPYFLKFQAPYILPVDNLRMEGAMETRTSSAIHFNPEDLVDVFSHRAKPFPLSDRDNLKANGGINTEQSE